MKLSSDKLVQCVLVVVAVVLVGYLVMNYLGENNAPVQEQFIQEGFYADEAEAPADEVQVAPGQDEAEVEAAETLGDNESPKGLDADDATTLNQLPAECGYKDVLTSADLLPNDANSKWAQVSPSGQGSLQDKNFLTAGHHIGINTVGQTLRNANRQLRSDPPNPQVKVSPWNQTTIESDTNRRPLEIGS